VVAICLLLLFRVWALSMRPDHLDPRTRRIVEVPDARLRLEVYATLAEASAYIEQVERYLA
jgi:hypothetical protein